MSVNSIGSSVSTLISSLSSNTSGSENNKVYDKMDDNKDGTVSASEKSKYYVSHPAEKIQDEQASATNKSGYDKNGTTEENTTAAMLNVSA
jgi:hypothetical protein